MAAVAVMASPALLALPLYVFCVYSFLLWQRLLAVCCIRRLVP